MKNYEKFFDVILSAGWTHLGVDKTDNSIKPCDKFNCSDCLFYEDDGGCFATLPLFSNWCREEYRGLPIDPRINNKTPIDTKILVSRNGKTWYRRHFCRREKNLVIAYAEGKTSFTKESDDKNATVTWAYAKLYEE